MSLDFTLTDHLTGEELLWKNITHNLNKMADEAGVYEILWKPSSLHEDLRAGSIVPKLEKALLELITEPKRFDKFNAPNGWGKRENLIEFIAAILKVAKENEFAKVSAHV